MKRGFFISICLHLLPLLIFMLPHGSGNRDEGKKGGSKQSDENGDFQKQSEKDGEEQPKKDDLQVYILPAQPKKQEEGIKCPEDSWYGGIGVEINEATGEIYKAAPFYPAYKAGIRPGDINISDVELRGDPGTAVEVKVAREGQTLSFMVTREKICYTKNLKHGVHLSP